MQMLSTEALKAQIQQGSKIREASEKAFGLEKLRKSRELRVTDVYLTDLVQRVIGWETNMPSALRRLHEMFAVYPEIKDIYTEAELKLLRYQMLHLINYSTFDYT